MATKLLNYRYCPGVAERFKRAVLSPLWASAHADESVASIGAAYENKKGLSVISR
jgi:hypothetical protein